MDSLDHWLWQYTSAIASDDNRADWLHGANVDDLARFLTHLARHPPEVEEQRRMVAGSLRQFVERLRSATPVSDSSELVPLIELTYQQLGAATPARFLLLQGLALLGVEPALERLADILATDAPADSSEVARICSPLFQEGRRAELARLFPRLLDGIGQLGAAAVILDVANFVTRTGAVPRHPAYDRRARLAGMLGDLALRLEQLDERAAAGDALPDALRLQIAESVPLAVALCHALALIGDPAVVPKLQRAFHLRHRRIRTEAAYALARLGEREGEDALLTLAAEPGSRLRVLAYADELGILDKVADEWRTDVARAEATLAAWLSEPTQLGLPPTSLELLDHRALFWPGYDEPVDCYLFRFTYRLAGGSYSNVGLVGPVTHVFAADLQPLSPEDIYAAFAGWQAEHAEIFEFELHRLSEARQRDLAQLERVLQHGGYRQIRPQILGSFFGDRVLVAQAERDGLPGLAVADAQHVQWHAQPPSGCALGPAEVYAIYKGRRLLEAFND